MTTRTLVGVVALFAGCAGSASEPVTAAAVKGFGVGQPARPTTAATPSPGSLPWPVGQTVRLTGTFAGWRGPCVGPPPVSRSDWMLVTAQGCIYVNGPLPGGSSIRPEAPDRRVVSVEGTVAMDRSGRKYLSLK